MDNGEENSMRGRASKELPDLSEGKALKGKIPRAFWSEINPEGMRRRKPLKRCETL